MPGMTLIPTRVVLSKDLQFPRQFQIAVGTAGGKTCTLLEKVGEGRYGVVWRVQIDSPGGARLIAALKIPKAASVDDLEEYMLSRTGHPHMVRLFGSLVVEERRCLLLEYCGNGSLRDYLPALPSLPLPVVRRIFLSLLAGVKKMQCQGIVHRDIRPEQVLLGSAMTVKLADLGLADQLLPNRRFPRFHTLSPYAAPEIYESEGGGQAFEDCLRSDVWSVGAIAFELAFGQLPFPLAKVQDGSWCHHSWADGIGMEPDAVALFGRIFTPPADRASPDDLADHDFFRRGVIAEYLPSPDSVGQPVYGSAPDSGVYRRLCREAGVGKEDDGTPRPCPTNHDFAHPLKVPDQRGTLYTGIRWKR